MSKNKFIEIVNRKARFDYSILDTWVAGISLLGSETKSIRNGHCSMVDSFCFFDRNELFIRDLEITPSKHNTNHEPKRPKKLLLKKTELNKIQKNLDQGITLIPLRVFEYNGWFKVEIALAKGKKTYDKRETIKQRDAEREINKNLKR